MCLRVTKKFLVTILFQKKFKVFQRSKNKEYITRHTTEVSSCLCLNLDPYQEERVREIMMEWWLLLTEVPSFSASGILLRFRLSPETAQSRSTYTVDNIGMRAMKIA